MRLDWASLLDLLRSTQRFVLTSHIRPDCDALGSELGLAAGLEALSKIDGVERHVRIVNAQATPASLACLDPTRRIESLEQGVTAADLDDREMLIVLDTSAIAQLGEMAMSLPACESGCWSSTTMSARRHLRRWLRHALSDTDRLEI
jgi:Exopolyphosphatase-related proteins